MPNLVKNRRLSLEISVIETLAQRLLQILSARDPLSERVHLKAPGVAAIGLLGIVAGAAGRVGRLFAASHEPRNA